MIPLGEFLTALLANATQGHAVADNRSGEIAQLYRESELLKHFPVPKLSISYIDLEVNMAITGHKEVPRIPEGTEDQFRKEAADNIQKNIPALPETRAFIKKLGFAEDILRKEDLTRFFRDSTLSLIKNIPSVQILDEETKDSCLSYFAENIIDGLEQILSRQKIAAGKKTIKESGPEKSALGEKIKQVFNHFASAWWKDFFQKNPLLPKDIIPIIAVEPKELLSVPPEKMTKAKIHLEVRPYEWTSIEIEDERKEKVIKYKLVPE
jgi:hypothetical protein